MIALIAFYLFAGLTIASALCVIFARNPVHSVLWLILAFFNAAGLMVLVGAEFIAMLLVIVYVGAVALLLACELVLGMGAYRLGELKLGNPDLSSMPAVGKSNIENIGALLYGK